MREKSIFISALFLLVVWNSFATCGERYKEKIFTSEVVYKDLLYGRNAGSLGDSMNLYLDVYTPPAEDSVKLRPVIFFIHGGAFIGGGKGSGTLKFMAKEMAQRGYVGVSVQYRLQESSIQDADPLLMFADKTNWYKSIGRGVQDIKAAIRYIKQDVALNGNRFGVDTNNIILYGSSAGAIAALHTVYLTDLNQAMDMMRYSIQQIGGLEGNSGTPGYYSTNTIRAVVSCSGALGNEDWIAHRKDVAYLAFHHTNDPAVPFKNGCFYTAFCHLGRFDGDFRLTNKAKELGVNVEMNIFEGAYHPADDLQPEIVRDSMVSFLYALQCNYDPSLAPVATTVIGRKSLEISLYPNPNKGAFRIAIPDNLSKTPSVLEIFNLSGQLVYSQIIAENQTNLSFQTDLSEGLYVVKLSSENPHSQPFLLGKMMVFH